MGVIYKLREEVVHFIVSQRQINPLASCRQLAESTSQKFGLNLSKSSVHDVLKESGIITPRGRKPKNKFEIPQEKKKQIQVSLSQINIGLPPAESKVALIADVTEEQKVAVAQKEEEKQSQSTETSPEYEGAGRIFLKAALWDLGVYSEQNIKGSDWDYFLTYSKGVNVLLENNKNFFIELRLPLERCIREVADGLINNIKVFIIDKVSDQELFKACMDAQPGRKISSVSIVDENDHVLSEFNNIMETSRRFMYRNRLFVENNEINLTERTKSIFFPQTIDNNGVIDKIMNFSGFDILKKDEKVVTILIDDTYDNKAILCEAVEKLNSMCLYDDQDRLVTVVIKSFHRLEGDILPKEGNKEV
jgi:hypothetical protein